MMKITAALVTEHAVLLALFEQVERCLPGLRTRAEIQLLAGLVERLLVRHAAVEEDLVFLALDRTPRLKAWSRRFYQEHQEIDGRLRLAQSARRVAPGRRLLHAALQASRAHFAFEERAVFPMLEKTMSRPELLRLGRFWRHRGGRLARRPE
jgi:hemerythrin-like domain-containing protein